MARSVSTPNNAEVVCYQYRDFEDDFDWGLLIEDISESCLTYWPSLDKCDVWLDRENHALLENDLVYIGVSEYCGLVAIWIVPKDFDGYDDYQPLAYGWMARIKKQFNELFSELAYMGRFSNGEAVFSYKDTPGRYITSKGYDSYN